MRRRPRRRRRLRSTVVPARRRPFQAEPPRRPAFPDQAMIVVVGLGPAGSELTSPQAADAIRAAPRCFFRTFRHPAAAAFARDGAVSFDDAYEQAASIDEVYAIITERLLAEA